MRARRAVSSLVGLVLLATLGACGGDDEPEFAAAQSPSQRFDVYFTAIDDKGGGGSELFGLTLNPLQTHRLTGEATAFFPVAAGDRVLVSAGEGKDRLGLLAPDGTVGPIPGLGRPVGRPAAVLPDGRIRWTDFQGKDDELHRLLEWNPATSKKRVLDQTRSARFVRYASGPGEGWVKAVEGKETYRLIVVTPKKTYTHKLSAPPVSLSAGREWIAVQVPNEDGSGDDPDHVLQFFHPRRGMLKDVEGLEPIAWSPGGRRLLVAAEATTGEPVELREMWFNPGGVAHRPLGTIPAMQIGYGTWRTGIPAPLCKECSDQPTLEKDY